MVCLEEYHSEELWLMIEVMLFWLYMAAIVLYIGFNQMRGWCKPNHLGMVDLTKQLVDFLEYSRYRMTFAVILCTQMLGTLVVNIWGRGAVKVQIGLEGSLPYEDKVLELSVLMWVLLSIHAA